MRGRRSKEAGGVQWKEGDKGQEKLKGRLEDKEELRNRGAEGQNMLRGRRW